MAGLADMIAWRARLIESRSSGVRRVKDSNGEEVEYRSVREMNAALAALDAEIASASGNRQPVTINFRTSKGL